MTQVTMTVNGKAASGEVEGRTLLSSFLRDELKLTGTHVGCDTSQCGACVVHVDGVAVVTGVADEGDSTRVTLEAPEDLARFIAPKGSVALNGTSLTVNEVYGASFGINFIPHTKQVTTWGRVAVGDRVNLEIDTLARYVARLAEAG